MYPIQLITDSVSAQRLILVISGVSVRAESVSVVLASLADAALLDHAHANWRALLSGGSEQAQQQQQPDERVAAFGDRERELLAQKLEDPTLRSLLQVCSLLSPPRPIVCSAGALRCVVCTPQS